MLSCTYTGSNFYEKIALYTTLSTGAGYGMYRWYYDGGRQQIVDHIVAMAMSNSDKKGIVAALYKLTISSFAHFFNFKKCI